MSLTVRRLDGVDEFLDVAGEFLSAREAENNLIFGICSGIRATPELYSVPPRFALVTDAGERVVAAALRTPPWNQVISTVDDPAAVDALADALADEALPGLLAPVEVAERFVARWTERTGRTASRELAERIFRLGAVVPPERPAHGSWRLAEPRDQQLVARWLVAFHDEANPGAPLEDPDAMAQRWVAGVGRTLYLWEDDGTVTSLVGAGGATPNGIRIGPVYTAPERRGRGYASSLTAAASQDQLDRGRTFCFLFTDLSNPTSNKIYRAIGYEPVIDVDQYRFGDA